MSDQATGQSSVGDLPDGTLVTGGTEVAPYLIENGRRRLIPSPAAFFAGGFDKTAVKTIAPEDLASIPLGDPLALTGGAYNFASGDVFLGAGHYMNTHGSLDTASGTVAAMTRIWTITWFGGYHGSVHVIFADQNDAPVWQSQDHRYGVDGTWIGTSDRTESWFESMNPADTARINRYYIFHAWAPDDFMTILNNWVQAAQAVSQLVTAVSDVAKVVAAAFA